MQIEINEQTVDRQLVDAGMKSDHEEQAIRQMFFHLFCAIRYYRDMTYAEKNKAGFLYRTKFKNTYSLTGFFKERKRKRDKKSSPLHPSYKEESGVLGKEEKTPSPCVCEMSELEKRQKAFWDELLKYEGKFGRKKLLKFYYYWAEEMQGMNMMKWEFVKSKKSWNLYYRLEAWSEKPFEKDDEAAALRLEREKKKTAKHVATTAEQQAIAAKRAADNARLEQEIRERKAKAVSHEEYLKMKHES